MKTPDELALENALKTKADTLPPFTGLNANESMLFPAVAPGDPIAGEPAATQLGSGPFPGTPTLAEPFVPPITPTFTQAMRVKELQALLPVLRRAEIDIDKSVPRYDNNVRYIRGQIEQVREELKLYGSAEIPSR